MEIMNVIREKNALQIQMHERAYGAKLGELKNPPTKKQLDKDFEDRRAKGELFSQQLDRQTQNQKKHKV